MANKRGGNETEILIYGALDAISHLPSSVARLPFPVGRSLYLFGPDKLALLLADF